MLLGTLQVLADEAAPGAGVVGVPIESLILPSVAAVACLGAIRLVPFGLWLVPALGVTWLIVDPDARARGAHQPRPGGLDDGRPDGAPGHDPARRVPRRSPASRRWSRAASSRPGGGARRERTCSSLAAGDALVAGLLGYRAAALRVTSVRDALWSALTYAAAIAIGAAAIRAMEIPRLVGPALLTLAFYLWDAFIGSVPARRRDRRWIGQVARAGRARRRRRGLEPAAAAGP